MSASPQPAGPFGRLAATALGAEFTDPHRRRERVYAALAEHPDPLLREIGQQLRDGLIRPMDLARDGAYEAVLRHGVEVAATFDVEGVVVAAEAAELSAVDGDTDAEREF